jgi:mono/diheme cytochrome c family protein
VIDFSVVLLNETRRSKTAMKTARLILVLFILLGFSVAILAQEATQTGEELFKQNCSPCHPNGGNIFNKQKTLSKKDREANKINNAADIVRKMRNPGAFDFHPNQWSGMKVFDRKTLSDKDAEEIAKYVIATFN